MEIGFIVLGAFVVVRVLVHVHRRTRRPHAAAAEVLVAPPATLRPVTVPAATPAPTPAAAPATPGAGSGGRAAVSLPQGLVPAPRTPLAAAPAAPAATVEGHAVPAVAQTVTARAARARSVPARARHLAS